MPEVYKRHPQPGMPFGLQSQRMFKDNLLLCGAVFLNIRTTSSGVTGIQDAIARVSTVSVDALA